MSNKKENFLDSTSLIAICILVLSWLAWDYYMKQKYPPVEKKAQNGSTLKEDPKTSPPFKIVKTKSKEKTFRFEGKNMDIVFSSKGLGLRSLKLKAYKNRERKTVLFENQDTPFFSSFLKDKSQFVPFKVKREGNVFIGVFSSSFGSIRKTLEVDDQNFIIKSKIEIEPSEENQLKSLSLLFSHPLPAKKKKSFFEMFLIYGQEVFKGFVSHNEGKRELWIEEDLEELGKFSQVNTVALGGKYFGKAFINESSLFPFAHFLKQKDQVLALVDYELLHSKAVTLEYKAFLGPKSLKNFQFLGGEIKQWLDFGFFGWLARPLLLFLNWLHSWCKNWGLAIILLTVFVRLGLLPINIKSYKSMKVMQKIQPQIKELKETHKADPKKMNLEVMALMKKHKANPLGGCLPLFIQFPVFFALYRVLGESIELYQSPFMFWIQDLSQKDPFYILPILGGLVLFVQQSITPMNLPKEQARLMKAIPLLFSVFMLSLPSGLTLYIFVSGLFGLIQQFFFVKKG